MRQRRKSIELRAHVEDVAAGIDERQIDRGAARMRRAAPRIGEKIWIGRVIPQRPLRFAGTESIENLEAQAKRFRQMIESPVLTNVKARFEGLDVYDVEPAQLPDVLGERPVIVFGKWRGEPKGNVVIEGNTADGEYSRSMTVGSHVRQDAVALRYLWARHRIQALSDQEALEGGDRLAKRITDLGLQYNLLTQYTSFIAVDHVVRNLAQESVSVDQPSPLPQGVDNLALGFTAQAGTAVPSTPEPGTWAALAVVVSMLAMLARRARRRNIARFTA